MYPRHLQFNQCKWYLLYNHQYQAKTFSLVSRIMDYDPRDFYDEIEAQFADEMEAMGDFQKKPEDDDPSGYM